MSQITNLSTGGGGGGGIITINLDSGSITGSAVSLKANNTAGSSVSFSGSGTDGVLNVTDGVLFNTTIGLNAGNLTISGAQNTSVGSQSLTDLTSGGFNTGVGGLALSRLQSGANNVAIGYAAGYNYTGLESSNITIGAAPSGSGTTGESNTLRIGLSTGTANGQLSQAFISGISSFFTTPAMAQTYFVTTNSGTDQLGHTTGTDSNNNTFVGALVGNPSLTGVNNTGFGSNTLASLTTGNTNNAFGFFVLDSVQDGDNNVAMGFAALTNLVSGNMNTAIGDNAGSAYTTAESSNICIGGSVAGTASESNTLHIGNGTGTADGQLNQAYISGISSFDTTPAMAQTFFVTTNSGTDQLGNTTGTDGNNNTFLGLSVGNVTLSGGSNTAFGHGSQQALTSGNNNTSVGDSNLINIDTGVWNTSIGSSSSTGITSGSRNITIGVLNNTVPNGAESDNILIGNSIAGVSAESNTLRIGNGTGTGSSQLNQAFISGIAGITVGSSAAVLINTTTGQLGTVISSRKYKDDIEDLESDKYDLMQLRPVSFLYKDSTITERQIGLIAEEVEEVIPSLVLYKNDEPDSVKYHDLPILLLQEIQKLNRRIEYLEGKLNVGCVKI